MPPAKPTWYVQAQNKIPVHTRVTSMIFFYGVNQMKNLMVCLALVIGGQALVAQQSSLASADGNSDGTVTVEEFAAYAKTRLRDGDNEMVDKFASKVDADGNGEISDSEFAGRMEVFQAMSEMQEEADDNDEPLKVGDEAADFELKTIDGTIKLSDNFGDDGNPVVVVFSRANW